MDTIDIKGLFIFKRTCVRCFHKWFPRSRNPQRCPRCQTWLNNPAEDEKAQKEAPANKSGQ